MGHKSCEAHLSKLLLLLIILIGLSSALTITSPPALASGALNQRAQASSFTNCDGVGYFFCPTGTCYLGQNGFVGCCSVSSCAARTTCIPYTENAVQTCNQDTGGCIVCNEKAPACVTLKNAVDHRWIMYCDSEKLYQTISYTPLVTTGSMAAPPSAAPSMTATQDPAAMTKTSMSAANTNSSITPTSPEPSPNILAPTPPNDYSTGFSRKMVVGMSVGSGVGSVAIMVLILLLLKKRSRRKKEKLNEGLKVLSSSDRSTDTGCNTSEDHQMPEHPTSPFRITPAKARRLSTEHDRRAHEMEATHLSSPPIESGRLSPSGPPPNWSAPPPGPKISNARGPEGNHPNTYIPYRPGITISQASSHASELSSIRHVQPSGSYRNSSTNPSSISSPAGNAYVVSPLVGSEAHTPLMDQWGNGDNASVGERSPDPSATVTGPVNWPSQLHIKPSRPGSGHGVRRSLTNATGGGSKWISPESAMAHGYIAGDDEDHEPERCAIGKAE